MKFYNFSPSHTLSLSLSPTLFSNGKTDRHLGKIFPPEASVIA